MPYSIQEKRKIIARAYPGEVWKRRVQKMPDNQVLAVYARIVKKGK